MTPTTPNQDYKETMELIAFAEGSLDNMPKVKAIFIDLIKKLRSLAPKEQECERLKTELAVLRKHGESMDIYSPVGSTVVIGNLNAGYDSDRQKIIDNKLRIDKEYTVTGISAGSFQSIVYLVEYPGIGFNTVNFKNVPQKDPLPPCPFCGSKAAFSERLTPSTYCSNHPNNCVIGSLPMTRDRWCNRAEKKG